ncbi:glycosyltransferase [Tardiphaga sp. P9-11]|uniref:glycosyltransferase n=1 Tax=Tardiphaga sp. P9-11 TaxID=2024614 RepID=UPI0011F34174|nr:glycosyltransferase [Tardiphaga sp. P9-11]KAA0074603.1 hypothetical protein CIW50_16970 [Tardiphaga sp. P9-11]
MKILFTNIQLSHRSGTEIVVRDLAQRFGEAGHEVTIYAPALGEFANEVRSDDIRVIDDLREFDGVPDIIHGHHTLPTAEAIIAFPSVPAIWVCHGAQSWFDQLPPFTQVRRIFAVDDTCRSRLVTEGVAPERIDILPNAVDLRRFQTRTTPLPARPARAVSLVKHSGPIELIVEACRVKGIPLELHGHGVGRPIGDIERVFAENDLVFATARTALEAMAVGAAVILVDGRGFGGLVTSRNFENGRRLNFGLGLLKRDPTLELLIGAIEDYDPLDAAVVSKKVRSEAGLDCLVARLEGIYSSTISQWRPERDFNRETFRAEQIKFNSDWLPRTQAGIPWMEEVQRLRNQATELNDVLARRTIELSDRSIELSECKRVVRSYESARSVRFARKLRQWARFWRG